MEFVPILGLHDIVLPIHIVVLQKLYENFIPPHVLPMLHVLMAPVSVALMPHKPMESIQPSPTHVPVSIPTNLPQPLPDQVYPYLSFFMAHPWLLLLYLHLWMPTK